MKISERNIPLDVLRTLAVLLVFGAHFDTPLPTGWTRPLAAWWCKNGPVGVDLFFVLSGFLISGLIFNEFQRKRSVNVGRFLIRRGFKLYPAYFVFIGYLLFSRTIKSALGGEPFFSALGQHAYPLWPNFLFVQNYWWFPGPTPAHTWSLAVEEHFYLVIPFVLAFLLRRNRLPWLFLVVAVGELFSLILRINGASPTHTHVCFTQLLAGVALRAAWVQWPQVDAFCKKYGFGLILLSILAFTLSSAVPTWLHMTLLEIAGVAIVAGSYHLSRDSFPKALHPLGFVPRFLAWIGFYSYSIYLWHVTVGRIADRYTTRYLDQVGWFPCMIASSIVVLAAGILMANLVEYPVLRLRERLFPSDTRAARPEPTLAESPVAVAPVVVPEPVLASSASQGSANT